MKSYLTPKMPAFFVANLLNPERTPMGKSRYLVCCITATIFCAISFGALAQSAAGTLAYTWVDGEIMLLLADHAIGEERSRGWGGFGGSRKEGETLVEAAARETEEESRGYYPRALVQHNIRNQAPVIDGKFALFFLEVPYIDAALIYRQPVAGLPEAYHERGPFAWMPYTTIIRNLEKLRPGQRMEIEPDLLPEAAASTWYWDIWLGNIIAALGADAMPWTDDDRDD
jgi:hypothetical protein